MNGYGWRLILFGIVGRALMMAGIPAEWLLIMGTPIAVYLVITWFKYTFPKKKMATNEVK